MVITTVTTMTEALSDLRLWQLISPALPVGAYAYSGGLESAIEYRHVSDETEALTWISGVMQHALGQLDVPVCQRFCHALASNDSDALLYWNRYLLASRESAELLQEDRHLGKAYFRLLNELDVNLPAVIRQHQDWSYIAMFACAIHDWQIPPAKALQGLLWSWCENQVAAAIKLIPLGQSAGQRVLSALQPLIPEVVEKGLQLADEAIGFTLPGLAMLSAQHETQYSRLFRS
jgi:urease accessory protein